MEASKYLTRNLLFIFRRGDTGVPDSIARGNDVGEGGRLKVKYILTGGLSPSHSQADIRQPIKVS